MKDTSTYSYNCGTTTGSYWGVKNDSCTLLTNPTANGFGYKLSDMEDSNLIKTFRFNRWDNDSKKSFKFRVDFKQPKDYSELVEFLSMMNTEIARFNDLGFYLQYLDVNTDKESDRYAAYSAEFNMES